MEYLTLNPCLLHSEQMPQLRNIRSPFDAGSFVTFTDICCLAILEIGRTQQTARFLFREKCRSSTRKLKKKVSFFSIKLSYEQQALRSVISDDGAQICESAFKNVTLFTPFYSNSICKYNPKYQYANVWSQ